MRDLWFPLTARELSSLCNGDEYTNVEGWHRGSTGGARKVIGWRPKVHRGNLLPVIDVEAPHEATGNALATLRTAAQTSLPAFGSAVRAEWGDAFADAVAPVLTDLRTDALALL